MWNKISCLAFALLVLTAACEKSLVQVEVPEEDPGQQEIPQEQHSRPMASLTMTASKGEDETKALSLDDNTLSAYWKSTERVQVYNASGANIGSLDVTPGEGEQPKSATLSGSIDVTGLQVGNFLALRIPRDKWSYSGQKGLLTGEDSIEQEYDYATAKVEISAIGETSVETSSAAHFENAQSIYRFGFVAGGNPLQVKLFVIGSFNNKIVREIEQGVTSHGALKLLPAASTDKLLYLSLRNESVSPESSGDTYRFMVVDSKQAAYLGTKAIPASVMDRHGKFISAKSVSVSKIVLPKGSVSTSEVW